MTKYHKIDPVTLCCIYCNRQRRDLFSRPRECERIMKPVDEGDTGPGPIAELLKHLRKK